MITPLDVSVAGTTIKPSDDLRSADGDRSPKSKKQLTHTGFTPISAYRPNDFAMARAWTKSFKRMKRAIALSEDNEVEHNDDDDVSESNLPGLPKNHEKQLVKLQESVFKLRKRNVKTPESVAPKLKL